MNITKKNDHGILKFSIEGKLDTSTAPKLQDELSDFYDEAAENKQKCLVNEVYLDCNNLTYISSAGLRVLLIIEKQSKSTGIPFILIGVSEDIMELFNMTGFDKLLRIN